MAAGLWRFGNHTHRSMVRSCSASRLGCLLCECRLLDCREEQLGVATEATIVCLGSELRRSSRISNMTPNTYEEEGGEGEWNTVADEDFDPNGENYSAPESPISQGGRGRGGHGRRGRGRNATSVGRGGHPEGTVVQTGGRGRGMVCILSLW